MEKNKYSHSVVVDSDVNLLYDDAEINFHEIGYFNDVDHPNIYI